jgi:hypothetical protein
MLLAIAFYCSFFFSVNFWDFRERAAFLLILLILLLLVGDGLLSKVIGGSGSITNGDSSGL